MKKLLFVDFRVVDMSTNHTKSTYVCSAYQAQDIFTEISERCSLPLTRAPLGYSAERAPLGGGADSAPCLTPERMVVERRENGKRKLSTRRILGSPTILLKEVRGQVRVRPKVKTTGFHIIGFRAHLQRSADRRFLPRTRPEVSETRCHT